MKISTAVLTAGGLLSALAGYSSDCAAQMRLWGTYYGGTSNEQGEKVKIDAAGNVYVVGFTTSANGISTPNGFDPVLGAATRKGYLAKFNSTGKLVWATYYGDGLTSGAVDVGLDSGGNIFVMGEVTCPSEALATPGAAFERCRGDTDMYLAKFGPSGNRIWGTYVGGDADEFAGGMSVTPYGDAYLIGTTTSLRGIALLPSQDSVLDGELDAFAIKFNPQGQPVWSRYYGGENVEAGNDIACKRIIPSAADRCFITGSTSSIGDIASAGAHDAVLSGGQDAFVALLDGTNGQRLWGTYYGGNGVDEGTSIVVGPGLYMYVGGNTASTGAMSSPNADDQTYNGGEADMFVAKFNYSGVRFYASYFGGISKDDLFDLAVDAGDNLYVLGGVYEPGDYITPNAFDDTLSGANDLALAKFNPQLDRVWATYYGGSKAELWFRTSGVAVDANNHVYLTGFTNSPDGMSTPGSHKEVKEVSPTSDAMLVEFVQ